MTGRHGFTLVELLVALMIAAIAVVLIADVFRAVNLGLDRLDQAALERNTTASGHIWLAEFFTGARATQAVPFEGEPRRATFLTSVRNASGWNEVSMVELAIDGPGLTAVSTSTGSMKLFEHVTDGEIDYLAARGSSSDWLPSWQSATGVPPAVRMRLKTADGVDTLIFVVGVTP